MTQNNIFDPTMTTSPRKTKKNGEPKKKTGPKGPHNKKQANIDPTKKHIFLPLETKLQILDKMAECNWSQSQTATYFTGKLHIPVTQVSISRWKEDEAFAKAAHKIQAILRQEHNAALKDRTIFDFFKPREVKEDQESKAKSPKGLISEPIGISDSESESEMSVDN